MSELEDIKLKALLNEMKLESPSANFSVRVMNKIFEEDSVIERIKKEKVLGKGFWIIIILFIALLATIVLLSNSGIQADGQIANLLPKVNSEVSKGYQSFFEKMGGVPLSVVGILIAASTLLFIERIISANSKIFVV
jgi:hypothetical protein